jgi:hypothetical protein
MSTLDFPSLATTNYCVLGKEYVFGHDHGYEVGRLRRAGIIKRTTRKSRSFWSAVAGVILLKFYSLYFVRYLFPEKKELFLALSN